MTSASSTTASTWVAIDVAKVAHQVLVETSNGRRRAMRIGNTASDIARLVTYLQSLPPQPCVIAFEPTGDYHRAGVDQAQAVARLNDERLQSPKVRAGVTGVLQLVPVEVGQRVVRGANNTARSACSASPRPGARPRRITVKFGTTSVTSIVDCL